MVPPHRAGLQLTIFPMVQLLQRSDTDPILDEATDLEQGADEGSRRRLLCRQCRAAITTEELRLDIDGRHVHRRINPAGYEFEFACFRDAPGAAVVGIPTSEHTWFPGFSWTFSLCAGCGSHLGWFFDGGEPHPFHGLILARLEWEE